MGYVGDQLRLHPLALDLFLHRLFKSCLDGSKLLLVGFEYTEVLLKGSIQIAPGNGSGCCQNFPVLFLNFLHIFLQAKVKHHRIYYKSKPAEHPEHTGNCQNDKIENYQLKDRLIRFFSQIHMENLLLQFLSVSLCKATNAPPVFHDQASLKNKLLHAKADHFSQRIGKVKPHAK